MNRDVLLIGLLDYQTVEKVLSKLDGGISTHCCQSTAQAKEFLRERDVELYILDVSVDYEACLEFWGWLIQHHPTYGALIGNEVENILAINALNTHLVLDVLLRPVPAAQWARLFQRRLNGYGLDHTNGLAPLWEEREPEGQRHYSAKTARYLR